MVVRCALGLLRTNDRSRCKLTERVVRPIGACNGSLCVLLGSLMSRACA